MNLDITLILMLYFSVCFVVYELGRLKATTEIMKKYDEMRKNG